PLPRRLPARRPHRDLPRRRDPHREGRPRPPSRPHDPPRQGRRGRDRHLPLLRAMSILSRVRAWFAAEPGAPPAPEKPGEEAGTAGDGDDARDPLLAGAREEGAAKENEVPAAVRRLAVAGSPEGPSVDEAIATLRQVRGTVLEATAVAWAMRGAGV